MISVLRWWSFLLGTIASVPSRFIPKNRRYSAYGGQIDKVTIQIYPKATDVAQQ